MTFADKVFVCILYLPTCQVYAFYHLLRLCSNDGGRPPGTRWHLGVRFRRHSDKLQGDIGEQCNARVLRPGHGLDRCHPGQDHRRENATCSNLARRRRRRHVLCGPVVLSRWTTQADDACSLASCRYARWIIPLPSFVEICQLSYCCSCEGHCRRCYCADMTFTT
jgi:hypothetical protein